MRLQNHITLLGAKIILFQTIQMIKCIQTFFQASPGRSPIHGNLTGISRKVKDASADWNNYDKKWTSTNQKGFRILREIADMKIQLL